MASDVHRPPGSFSQALTGGCVEPPGSSDVRRGRHAGALPADVRSSASAQRVQRIYRAALLRAADVDRGTRRANPAGARTLGAARHRRRSRRRCGWRDSEVRTCVSGRNARSQRTRLEQLPAAGEHGAAGGAGSARRAAAHPVAQHVSERPAREPRARRRPHHAVERRRAAAVGGGDRRARSRHSRRAGRDRSGRVRDRLPQAPAD